MVTLYSEAGEYVDEAFTDGEGYYFFTGLPFVRYMTEVDYPECDGRHLTEMEESESRSYIPSDNYRAFKFYKSGDVCDVMLVNGYDGDNLPTTTWNIVHFDTLDECCANLFWFDIDGCSSRSPVVFQFEFCVDVSGIAFDDDEHRLTPDYCPSDDIRFVEREMRSGLGINSTLALVRFGNAILSGAEDDVKCDDGPTTTMAVRTGDVVTNMLRRGTATVAAATSTRGRYTLTICGVVVTRVAPPPCIDEACLKDKYDTVIGPFGGHLYGDMFASSLRSTSASLGNGDKSHHRAVIDMRNVEVVTSSLTTRKLMFSSSAGVASSKDVVTDVTTEDPAMIEVRPQLRPHAKKEEKDDATDTPHHPRAPHRYYPTYVRGKLCQSKSTFDSWEQSHATLRECCDSHFSWDLTACCGSLDMGGC
jgi:hypothetical protein